MDTPNSHLPIIYAKVVFQNRCKTLIDVYTHRNNFIRSGPNLNFMNLPSICYEQIFRIRRNRVSSFRRERSEEHTSELQSLMRISYAVFCLKKKINMQNTIDKHKYILTSHKHLTTH